MVWTSRVLVGTHFPHQCLLGTFLGFYSIRNYFSLTLIYSLIFFTCPGHGVIETVYKRKFWMRMSRLRLLLILIAMFLSITAIHFISLALEVDPNWSITSAIQWCYGDYDTSVERCWKNVQCLFPDRSWISTTSNSWTLMMTYTGSGLGLVTSLTSPLTPLTSDGPGTWPGLGAGLLLTTAVSLSTWVISNCLLRSQSRLGE